LQKALNRPVIVFTTFWDADYLVKHRTIFVESANQSKALKINLLMDDSSVPDNFSVKSIALSSPHIDKLPCLQCFGEIERLDFFCPTYNMLSRYKKDRDWESYTEDYMALIRDRKDLVKDWLKSLKKNHVYILCCWENTSVKAKCHRRLIYDAFMKSKVVKNNTILIYRHGNSPRRKDLNAIDIGISSRARPVPLSPDDPNSLFRDDLPF
jgi:hypothetical protein